MPMIIVVAAVPEPFAIYVCLLAAVVLKVFSHFNLD